MLQGLLYLFLRGLSLLVSLLPYGAVLFIGSGIGVVCYYLLCRRRCLAAEQMALSLGLGNDQVKQLTRSCFRKLGQSFMEFMYYPCITAANIHRYVEVEGREHLDAALARGCGVVLFTAHFGNWELMAATLGLLGYPLMPVGKVQKPPGLYKFVTYNRTSKGLTMVTRGMGLRNTVKWLKEGKIILLLMDQHAGNGVVVDFFGRPAATPEGPAVFAGRHGAPAIPAFIMRKPGGGHRLTICPPVPLEKTLDEAHDIQVNTARMTKVIEDFIAAHPDEWFWVHNRWKYKPKTGVNKCHNSNEDIYVTLR